MTKYRIAKGWRIFMFILCPPLIALFVGLLLSLFFSSDQESKELSWLYIPLSLSMISLFTIGLIETIKSAFIIEKDQLYTIGTFKTRLLLFTEIKGYRVNERTIIIEPICSKKKKIKIPIQMEKFQEIIQWLDTKFPDLDKIFLDEQEKHIQENIVWGASLREREETFQKAKRQTRILNWTAGIVALWTFIYPFPYQLAIISCMLIPLIALIVLKRSKGLIQLNDSTTVLYPSVVGAIFFPIAAMMVRALQDFNILHFQNCWIIAILATLIFEVLLLITFEEFRFKELKSIVLSVFTVIHIFGFMFPSVMLLNCAFDDSPADRYPAEVLEKWENTGKHTSHYVRLTPWGENKEPDDVSVSKSFYTDVQKGEAISVYLKKGLFHIPWYYLDY